MAGPNPQTSLLCRWRVLTLAIDSQHRSFVVWLAAALVVRTLANLVAMRLGFVAVSDDDFARVAIAQNFAHTPRWDASGTSWLPAPFWLTGSAMMLLGKSFDVARCVAWLTSLASVIGFCGCGWAVGLHGRWLGLAGVWFAALPHAVWLGLATVPEGYTAVLALGGLCALRGSTRVQMLGAVAVALATLCRYETWPIALVVAGYHLVAGFRTADVARRVAVAATSLAGIAAWLANGAVSHESALFFVKRVSDYRAAIGGTPGGWLAVLGNYPKALFVEEPVLLALVVASGGWALSRGWRSKPNVEAAGSLARGVSDSNHVPAAAMTELVCGAAAVVAFLVWGDVTNGAPTHHPERALLPVWLIAILVATHWLARPKALSPLRFDATVGDNPSPGPAAASSRPSSGETHTATSERMLRSGTALTAALATLALGSGLVRAAEKQFVDRSHELSLGKALGPELTSESRLWLETEGYGYVAVSVGSQKPWLVDGFNAGDPRQAAHPPPFANPTALAEYFVARKVRLVVVPKARATAFESWARAVDVGQSVIFRLPAAPTAENSEPPAD